jgi:hypothetical protein
MECFEQSLDWKKVYKSNVKGIVSRDFGTLFLISLYRFEGRNRAG